jgi:hypothetical protein
MYAHSNVTPPDAQPQYLFDAFGGGIYTLTQAKNLLPQKE